MSETVLLDERLDMSAAVKLAEQFSKLEAGASVTLDGSKVTFFGAQTAQVILSAARHFKENQISLDIVDLSPRGTAHLEAMGFSESQLMEKGE